MFRKFYLCKRKGAFSCISRKFLSRYNQQTTSILDEEGTVYIDQLKEYLFFADSLRFATLFWLEVQLQS